MQSKIFRLPEEEINKIAAGEVVENPASIVKELIENSLDAGAKRIEIALVKGGQELIRIDDDGSGISPEDVKLAVERHATSKIRTAKDLEKLFSMGFRGEALAAIAAVSEFEMKTSLSLLGTHFKTSFGKEETISSIARNRGTTVEVRSLFYNVPARRKFLKSSAASTRQVVKVVETLAIAHPDVSFALTSNEKSLLALSQQKRRERIETVLGPFETEFSAKEIWGLLASPLEASSERRSQYVYVNGRPIFSPLVAKAVQMGYGTRLFEGFYPSFVLFLELDPSEFDVNIHPQKKEIRFASDAKIFQKVKHAVENAFLQIPAQSSSPVFADREEEFLFSSSAPLPYRYQSSFQGSLDFEFSCKALYLTKSLFLFEKGGLFLMDLVRAEKRILFERLKNPKNYLKELPTPLTIEVEEEETALKELEELGLEGQIIAKKALLVEALFEEFPVEDFKEFFRSYQKSKKIEKALFQASFFGKRVYTFSLAEQIYRWLNQCSEKEFDPEGERIVKEIHPTDLARILGSGKK